MFGVTSGFDIVIGNPPYGVSIKGEFRNKVIKSLGKVPDYEIYYYFIELAHKLLSHLGTLTYIIPNTFLFNIFAFKYRIKLIEKWGIECILDCTAFKIFEAATIFNTIIIFSKKNRSTIGYKNTLAADSFISLANKPTIYIPKSNLINNNHNWGLVFKLNIKILKLVDKIKSIAKPLEEMFKEYSQGLIAYDKYQGQSKKTIENRIFHYERKIKPTLKKWLWGEDIKQYSVTWNGKEWIDYCDGIANPRQPKFFKGKRVLIREITNPSIFCAYTEEELYHDPSIIVVLDNSKNDIKYLLAVLNSKLASFFHFNSSPKATKGVFPKILVEDIKQFPLVISDTFFKKEIQMFANQLLEIKNTHKKNMEKIKNKIDVLIYKTYELTFEEVKIVDPEIEKIISKEEYEKFES